MNVANGDIDSAYLYAFGIKDIDEKVLEESSLLEKYYVECLMIAATDVLRDWIRSYIERKHSVRHKKYVTDSFGPGFYGMEMEMTETLLALMNAEKAGVSYENGSMQPAMSVAGIYLVSKEDVFPVCRDCEDCIGQKSGCEFCKNYTR